MAGKNNLPYLIYYSVPSFNIFIYSLYANILFLFFCETSSNISKLTKFSKLECIVAVLKLL